MYIFHFTEITIPWGAYFAAVLITFAAGTFIPLRWFLKHNNSKVSAWAASILTGLAAAFILATTLIIITSNIVNTTDNNDKKALNSYIQDNYDFTVNKDDLAVLYWSQDEGNVPVTAVKKDGETTHIYLGKYKDGWTIYQADTNKRYPQK
jgi:predicted PurR-regulated permease PerM